jgi:hypothetical protein
MTRFDKSEKSSCPRTADYDIAGPGSAPSVVVPQRDLRLKVEYNIAADKSLELAALGESPSTLSTFFVRPPSVAETTHRRKLANKSGNFLIVYHPTGCKIAVARRRRGVIGRMRKAVADE